MAVLRPNGPLPSHSRCSVSPGHRNLSLALHNILLLPQAVLFLTHLVLQDLALRYLAKCELKVRLEWVRPCLSKLTAIVADRGPIVSGMKGASKTSKTRPEAGLLCDEGVAIRRVEKRASRPR
ncbi:hypothetical protein BC937DRAFT_90664 [Endogone sp. FLAS-F59071]|nr:hypothetical protein BC937DRAFT_90664 [Endogone sp. FLAS-F59071]|eukprot:RUS16908.1 hypothetical protein BC937DRAFT_90664 [Endogone sp. FLAS-F59071]